MFFFFFFQAEDGIRDLYVTGVQTCALPISASGGPARTQRASPYLGRSGQVRFAQLARLGHGSIASSPLLVAVGSPGRRARRLRLAHGSARRWPWKWPG